MNTELSLPSINLTLYRYPKRSNEQLQAWDSADEYIINTLAETEGSKPSSVLIFNDSFGALTCALTNKLTGAEVTHQVTSISDSWISHAGIQQNLAENQINNDTVVLQDCSAPLPTQADLVLIKIPRTLSLLEHQLAMLSQVINPKTQIIAAGKVKDIHNSTLALFEKYIGDTKTSLAKKKSRLIFSTPSHDAVFSVPDPITWPVPDTPFTISNGANVFSRSSLDIGARFFMQHLPQGDFENIIDLGCGNGIIGLMAATSHPKADITFVDESFLAVESARNNVATNIKEHKGNIHFLANNCLYNYPPHSADLVLCNPPFHQQQALTDHIAWQMFKDAHRALRWGGELYIVGNRHLDYHVKLDRLFNNHEVVASNAKFVIMKAKK